MKTYKGSRRIAIVLCVILLMSFAGMTTVMAMSGTLSAHTIPKGATMYYYKGNGYSVAKNGYVMIDADLDNQYQWSAGYYNVTTEVSTQKAATTSNNAHFSSTVPATALYKLWIRNRSSVPMTVRGGVTEYMN